MEPGPLRRVRDERVIAGVCAGLAEHLGVQPVAARIAMLVFALFGGAGVIFYLWLWATVPLEGESEGILPMRRALTRPASAVTERRAGGLGSGEPGGAGPGPASGTDPDSGDPGGAAGGPAERRDSGAGVATRPSWPVAEMLLGGCLLIAGAALVLFQLGVQLRLEVILPAMAVLVGVGLTWWQIADRDRPDRNQIPRVLAALALVAVGVLMFFVTARQPNAWTVIAAALAVLAGVAFAIAPWLLRINRELMAERAGRARETERAEIAAHLHDSVLQTLALIQQRSEPGSDVSRLARGQERELREWLFRTADGAAPEAREAIDVELRAHAAALEEHHAVRFEVVVVGGAGSGRGAGQAVPEAIVAAAREAMLNAARHAGGSVTVYIELAPGKVSVDVTDRGPGLDAAALPDGRMGVRESILGRMARAGGTARIVAGPGGSGTSVRLSMPLDAPPDAPGGTGSGAETAGGEAGARG
ncbi:PspC domain-containing protein [Leucobacter sp. CSA1]|uniref:PspC domain-containing protein n=1 Tax=Leucobacter chromiisoli TaxID=2796471 RepID=A0A934QA44_9MICO|nr:ATP-binding protein [Leucobacter chromiisoli]MBK0419971.1 PspC domain-containing protein [Leucobacter chromiisoli]